MNEAWQNWMKAHFERTPFFKAGMAAGAACNCHVSAGGRSEGTYELVQRGRPDPDGELVVHQYASDKRVRLDLEGDEKSVMEFLKALIEELQEETSC